MLLGAFVLLLFVTPSTISQLALLFCPVPTPDTGLTLDHVNVPVPDAGNARITLWVGPDVAALPEAPRYTLVPSVQIESAVRAWKTAVVRYVCGDDHAHELGVAVDA